MHVSSEHRNALNLNNFIQTPTFVCIPFRQTFFFLSLYMPAREKICRYASSNHGSTTKQWNLISYRITNGSTPHACHIELTCWLLCPQLWSRNNQRTRTEVGKKNHSDYNTTKLCFAGQKVTNLSQQPCPNNLVLTTYFKQLC